jgi:hypothetical protein
VSGAARAYTYRVEVAATRPITDYTVRAIPNRDGVAVPLESGPNPMAAMNPTPIETCLEDG